MPIYAYKCASCGHGQDVLQKVSDAPLTLCPACGQAGFAKQVTAAGFQLKGSGWYATDFRGGSKPAGDDAGDKAEPKADAKTEAKADTKAEAKAETKSESKPAVAADKPAAAKPGAAAADAA